MTYSLHAFKNWTTNFLDFYNHSHSFPNSIERCLDFPSSVGRWKILLGGTLLCCSWDSRRRDVEHWQKLKLVWAVCKKSIKLKQKLCRSKLKMKFSLGYNMEIVIWWWRIYFLVGELTHFQLVGKLPPSTLIVEDSL